jgi:ribosomal protein S18 acetylase RimI-like enzyme
MSELKHIRVREAKPRDIGLFKKLWSAYLKEQSELGNLVEASDFNLEVYANIFKMYIDPNHEAPLDGAVLFVADKGVIMWGSPGASLETKLGVLAQGWGQYVTPDARQSGIATAMVAEMIKKLRERGFDTLMGGLIEDDEASTKTMSKVDHKWDPVRPMYFTLHDGDKE